MAEKRAVPELSVDTQVLERLLRQAAIGAVVTYAEMAKAIGRDVQDGARHLMQSARRRLLAQDRIVFGVVINVGLKRLDDHGVVGTAAGRLKHIRRTATAGAREMGSVQDFAALPNDEKIRHNMALGVYGVLRHVTKEKTLAKLAAATGEKLPLAKMLEAVKENL
jgi:hypothetical protein